MVSREKFAHNKAVPRRVGEIGELIRWNSLSFDEVQGGFLRFDHSQSIVPLDIQEEEKFPVQSGSGFLRRRERSLL